MSSNPSDGHVLRHAEPGREQHPDGARGKQVVVAEDGVGRVAQPQELAHRLRACLAVGTSWRE